jgi:hypothetical protein
MSSPRIGINIQCLMKHRELALEQNTRMKILKKSRAPDGRNVSGPGLTKFRAIKSLSVEIWVPPSVTPKWPHFTVMNI